ncbi:MAG: hypothetical protein ACOCXS_00585 [Bacteroidota bacterium]
MIKQLEPKISVEEHKRLKLPYERLNTLLNELKNRDLSYDVSGTINDKVAEINAFGGTPKALSKLLTESHYNIITLVKNEEGLFPKNYFQNSWLALGLSVFGLPIGVVWMAIYDNAAFIGLGLPIGLVIGMFIGMQKDKKVKKENKQLNIES